MELLHEHNNLFKDTVIDYDHSGHDGHFWRTIIDFVHGQEDTAYDGKGEAKIVDGGAITEEEGTKAEAGQEAKGGGGEDCRGLD